MDGADASAPSMRGCHRYWRAQYPFVQIDHTCCRCAVKTEAAAGKMSRSRDILRARF